MLETFLCWFMRLGPTFILSCIFGFILGRHSAKIKKLERQMEELKQR
jgi:hypothetical protein